MRGARATQNNLARKHGILEALGVPLAKWGTSQQALPLYFCISFYLLDQSCTHHQHNSSGPQERFLNLLRGFQGFENMSGTGKAPMFLSKRKQYDDTNSLHTSSLERCQ